MEKERGREGEGGGEVEEEDAVLPEQFRDRLQDTASQRMRRFLKNRTYFQSYFEAKQSKSVRSGYKADGTSERQKF